MTKERSDMDGNRKQSKTKKKHKGLIVVLSLLGVMILSVAVAIMADAPSRQELATLQIGEVDFGNLKDGVYTGEFVGTKGHLRDVTVEATVADGALTAIRIVKGAVDAQGKPTQLSDSLTIQDLFQRVIDSQSLQVDAISGATLSSNAHLKALENAVDQAKAD
jgi:uncharacterized protein with FMN-binding domain